MRADDDSSFPIADRLDEEAYRPPITDWRGCTATATGLAIPASASVEDWCAVGQTIHQADSAVQWWLGDWWRAGERYGRRIEVVQSDQWNGPTIETCRNAASVCRAFDVSRRRDSLRFSHHAEVAGLPSEKADLLLDWAAETIAATGKPRSTRELRAEVTRQRTAAQAIPVRARVVQLPREPVHVVATAYPAPVRRLADGWGPWQPSPAEPTSQSSQELPRPLTQIVACLEVLAASDGKALAAAVEPARRAVQLHKARAAARQVAAFIAGLEP